MGAPQAVTAVDGTLAWSADWEPFGSVVIGDSKLTSHIRFPGQYFDEETVLHYNYYRHYDPTTGRYIESDPIGLLGGLNPFAYVRSCPSSLTDPSGLYSCNDDGTVNPKGKPKSPADGAAAWAQDQYDKKNKQYTKAAENASCGGKGPYKCNCFVRDAYYKGGEVPWKDLPKRNNSDDFPLANELHNRTNNKGKLGKGDGSVGDIGALYRPNNSGHTGIIGCDGSFYSAGGTGILKEDPDSTYVQPYGDDFKFRTCCGEKKKK